MSAEKIKIDRSTLKIKPGTYAKSGKDIYKISQIIDFDEVIGIDVETGKIKKLLIDELKKIELENIDKYKHINRDIMDINDKDWKIVEERLQAILPLKKGASRKEIEEHAKNIGVHYTTLYRWFRNYLDTGSIAGLIPKKEGYPEGKTRIDPEAERVMKEVLDSFYLTKQRPKAEAVIRKVFAECHKRNIKPPSKNTVRNRIAKINEYERLARRYDRSAAKGKYKPASEHYKADYPLERVQIDHTQADIILVDEETRQPIGRPWITLAIDIYSRMIHGYYLSLEAPSATSVAMCIANAVLPKDQLLIENGIDEEWNIWGFMDNIHTDNGADFLSEALSRACLIHNIHLENRPVKSPEYGGHIERLIGTIMDETHLIPGTTFSNTSEKGKYNSDKQAVMTFKEYEKWLLLYITKIYHKRRHSSLGMSPEEKLKEGIFGTREHEGTGYPPKPSNPQSILIDFLPFFQRTVQRNGVNIDGLNYYDSVLRSCINTIDQKTGKKKKYIFKRDPRNISYVWFYDEDTQEYYKIPLANQSIPDMSLWEYKATKKLLKQKGITQADDRDIIAAYEELYKHVKEAAALTKKKRREIERKKINKEHLERFEPPKTSTKNSNEIIDDTKDDVWDDDDFPIL